MKPEVKEQWVNALRSEEFSQDKHKLKTDDGYCCLGVLCELAVRDGVPLDLTTRQGVNGPVYAFDQSDAILPAAVMQWAEIDATNPAVIAPDNIPDNEDDVRGGDETTLSYLNDYAEMNFKDIADVIEDQF